MRLSLSIAAAVLLAGTVSSYAQYGDAYHKPNTAKLESDRRAREQADRDYHYNRNKPSSTTKPSSSGGSTNEPAYRWQTTTDGRPTGAQADEMRRLREADAAAKEAEQLRKAREAAEQERIRMQDPAYRKKKADEAAAREAFKTGIEQGRVPVRKQFLEAGFTVSEAETFAAELGLNPANGQANGAGKEEAAYYWKALEAKKTFDRTVATGSYAELQPLVAAYVSAGETALRDQQRLLARFPDRSASARRTELAIIGVALGGSYGLRTYYLGALATAEAKSAARARWWEIYAQAPEEALASCGRYGNAWGCPVIWELERLRKALQECGYARGGDAARKASLADSIRMNQDLVLRIQFDPHSDGSRKDVGEVRGAYYDICADKDRFLSYTNEDWQVMARAQRTTPPEMVRAIMHRNSQSKAGQRAGQKVLARLEKAGIK